MDRHFSCAKLEFLAQEIDVRSGLRPVKTSTGEDPGAKNYWEDLTNSSGRIFRLRRVARSADPATVGIHRLLCDRFTEDEADTLETIQSDAPDPDVGYFVIQEKGGHSGEVLALMNVYVLPVETAKLQLFIGYVVTAKNEEGGGLASRLYRAAYLFFMRRAEIKACEAYAITGEMVEEVEEFFLKVGGCRRLYVDTAEGFREIPYIQPPLDFDRKTGEPLTQPVPEHLMTRLVDYRSELTATKVLEMVWSVYGSYFFDEEDFETTTAYQIHRTVIFELFSELKKSLPDPAARVFMFNPAVRLGMAGELAATGKKLVEIKA